MSNFSRNTLIFWLAVLWRFWCICFAMSSVRMEQSFDMLMDRYHEAVHMQKNNCYNLLINGKIWNEVK